MCASRCGGGTMWPLWPGWKEEEIVEADAVQYCNMRTWSLLKTRFTLDRVGYRISFVLFVCLFVSGWGHPTSPSFSLFPSSLKNRIRFLGRRTEKKQTNKCRRWSGQHLIISSSNLFPIWCFISFLSRICGRTILLFYGFLHFDIKRRGRSETKIKKMSSRRRNP